MVKNTLKKIAVSLISALSYAQIIYADSNCGPNSDGDIKVTLNEPLGNCSTISDPTAVGFLLRYAHIMYVYGASLVGIVCVLVIAISGMQYAMDSSSAEDAKNRITNALTGLAVLFLSAVFLNVINPNFFKA